MIVTDAWFPQTNGVVNTISQTAAWLLRFGHDVRIVSPGEYRTLPCPTYPEIRLAVGARRALGQRFEDFQPEAVHIATEGPLGLGARRHCRRRGLRFTTSYHTQFPEYLASRAPIPLRASYAAQRWFHSGGYRCMVSTQSIRATLSARGFKNLASWQRGVDTDLFRPRGKDFLQIPRPIAAYVGRLAVEKNVEAFLQMRWQGSKIVIGDGPRRARLQSQFPEARFTGFRYGEDLAAHLAAADVMVFPSLTDTFGLVNLEAMACGVPVAAFPVPGPLDVVEDGRTGALDTDLARAAERALLIDPNACRARALSSTWETCTRQFESNLVCCQPGAPTPTLPSRSDSTNCQSKHRMRIEDDWHA
ncbi:glycosyltransferase family 4 protein [Mycobacterium camsae]|uniref:glycosyltransferase family 4 protein n=1 Tax=Mycobacterium gordonae TaxID=1778 RepID=UPI001F11FAD5|nr:glycosyltransferase family 1 protein [Mycobacterium gordonae]